jgi:hypothetical protein
LMVKSLKYLYTNILLIIQFETKNIFNLNKF